MAIRTRDATATILSGQSLSAPVHIGIGELVAIEMPAAWDAAALTFQVSGDGGVNYLNAYDTSGNEITVTAAAGRTIPLNPEDYSAFQFFKVRSGTSGAPVNQTANRALKLLNRVRR